MEIMWEAGEIAVVENKNSEVLQNPGIAVKQLWTIFLYIGIPSFFRTSACHFRHILWLAG